MMVPTDTSIRYIRQIDVESSWREYGVYFNVRGGREVRVMINGSLVGKADDSRHWNEFLLSPLLTYSKPNTLTVEMMNHGQGELLEDGLAVGMNGRAYILFKNDPCVEDYSLTADYDYATQIGSLELKANLLCNKRKGKYYLESETYGPDGRSIGRFGRWVVFKGRSEEFVLLNQSFTSVLPWSAEHPNLYRLVLRLRNEKMGEEELLGTTFGFRRVELKDGQFQLNGKPITLKGVLYGIEKTGDPASREQMLKDVVAMKSLNVNAVRTARYSPVDPYFYDLCNRYGLYVVCDANLNPHSDQKYATATDAAFIPMFERRVDNMFGVYKNQTSIIAWSLGDCRDNGVCMVAAYNRLKALDSQRPVIFSGANTTPSTDLIAPILPTENELKHLVSSKPGKPCLILHAVKQPNLSHFEKIWNLVANSRILQGAFAAEWPLEPSFSADLKYLYCPFKVQLFKQTDEEAEFVVINGNDFSGFGNNILEYDIFSNYRPRITGGDIDLVLPALSSDKVLVRIPKLDLSSGEELFVRFEMRTPVSSHAVKEMILGTQEFALQLKQDKNRPMMALSGTPDSAWQATIPHLLFKGFEDWTDTIVGQQTRQPNANTFCTDYMIRYISTDNVPVCEVRCTRSVFGTGDVVFDYQIVPSDRIKGLELQPELQLTNTFDSLCWYGLDRDVCFPTNNSGLTGIYNQAVASITRPEVRWCSIYSANRGLFVECLDCRSTLQTKPGMLKIEPQAIQKFRLHLKGYTDCKPETLYGYDFPNMTLGHLPPPQITASEPRFSSPLEITISAQVPCQIRFTTDGTDPDETSPLYQKPISITSTTTVKARAFAPDANPSFVATRKFNYDYITRTTFSVKPNSPYNKGADTLLFDGIKGDVVDMSHAWLGFSGGQVTTTVQLSHPIHVDHIRVRYAHSPATWAFAPAEVRFALSSDGIYYSDTVVAQLNFDPSSEEEKEARVVEFDVAIDKPNIGFVNIIPTPIKSIPSWHKGKGLKPWLMIDEVEVIEK